MVTRCIVGFFCCNIDFCLSIMCGKDSCELGGVRVSWGFGFFYTYYFLFKGFLKDGNLGFSKLQPDFQFVGFCILFYNFSSIVNFSFSYFLKLFVSFILGRFLCCS